MAFCRRYIRFTSKEKAMLRHIDEKATMELLERDYDMEFAPKGEIAAFMNEGLVERWDQDEFEERLELFNEDLKHKAYVKTLAEEHGIHSPAQFVQELAEDFIQHFCDNVHDDREVAEIMLTFPSGGSGWLDMEGYSRYGVVIMDMFCSACEERAMRLEEEADSDEEEVHPKKRRAGDIQVSVSPEVYREFCQFMAAR